MHPRAANGRLNILAFSLRCCTLTACEDLTPHHLELLFKPIRSCPRSSAFWQTFGRPLPRSQTGGNAQASVEFGYESAGRNDYGCFSNPVNLLRLVDRLATLDCLERDRGVHQFSDRG